MSQTYPNLKSKLRTIPNFTDLEKFCPPKENTFRTDRPRVLVAGRVVPVKNVLFFLDAIKLLVDRSYFFCVHWFGSQEDRNYYEQCLKKVKKLNLDNYVSFHPPIEKIQEEYYKADLLCLPSLYEGNPNSVCEAMASGLPVLCSDVSDNRKIVEEGSNGFLFDPTSPEDIARAFEKFFSLSPEEKMKMGRMSRILAEQKFSKIKFLKNYQSLLN